MKRITTFLIAFICCVALYAQKDIVYKPVLLSIDKADGQYAAGETVNVYGQLMEDIGETEFVCYVESNGSMVGEKRMVQLRQGEKALVYSASFDEVEQKGFTLVPSRYIEFVNRDENIDFDTKMKTLQGELQELLVAEEKSKADLLAVFKELGYEINL